MTSRTASSTVPARAGVVTRRGGGHRHRAPERSLLGYLLLPRPKDLTKAWILPTTLLLSTLGTGGTSPLRLVRAALVWVALELLIYQARYQWNDIRGFESDQSHPDASARGRLPGPLERGSAHKLASAAAGCLRLGLVAALAVLPALHLATMLMSLSGAVLAVAVVYEQLRTRATGVTNQVPPPLRASLVSVWVIVGAGYAIRGVAGVALALNLSGRAGLTVAAVGALWCYGIAFVTARWLVEALAFARVQHSNIVWIVRPDQAREHLLALVRWLPTGPPPGSADGRLRSWQPLRSVTPLGAPWNAATAAAALAAGFAAARLTGAHTAECAGVAGLSGALAVVVLRSVRRVPVFLASAAGLAVLLLVAGVPRPGLTVLVWVVLIGSQLFFFSQSLDSIGRRFRALLASARAQMPGLATSNRRLWIDG